MFINICNSCNIKGPREGSLSPFFELASLTLMSHEASSPLTAPFAVRSWDISMHEIGFWNKRIFPFLLSTERMNTTI